MPKIIKKRSNSSDQKRNHNYFKLFNCPLTPFGKLALFLPKMAKKESIFKQESFYVKISQSHNIPESHIYPLKTNMIIIPYQLLSLRLKA